MPGFGYSRVTDKGFLAFGTDLSEGAWQDIDAAPYETDEGLAALDPARVTPQVLWKVRLLWALRVLARALGVDSLDKHDAEWDSAQRALAHFLAAAAEHPDPAHRQAARRLQGALLQQGGTGQTQLGYDHEVDYGRHQVILAAAPEHAPDVALLGAAAHLARIDQATEALGRALGRAPGQNRAPPRSRRIRDALATCSSTFNGVHEEIAWLRDTSAGPTRARLAELLAPLEALLARYPAAGSDT